MPAIIFALISSLGWGSGDIFGAIASRRIGAYTTTFWQFAIGGILFSFYIPFALPQFELITPGLFILNLALGSLYVSGNVTFNEALRRSSAPLVGTIAGSFPALVIILSLIFLGEKLTHIQALLILLIYSGIFLASVDFAGILRKNFLADKGIPYAFFSLISWGTYFTFVKLIMQRVGWFWPSYISILLFPLVYLFMRVKKEQLHKINGKNFLPICLSALLLRGGDFSFNIGSSLGLTSLVAPVAQTYPIVFAVLSFLVFKDPLTKIQIVGIVLALIGIVLLGLTGV